MTGFQLIEVGTRQAEQVRNMNQFMERGTNTPEGSATVSAGAEGGKAVFFPSAQRVRQGGNGEKHPPLKGGVFSPIPSPLPTQTAEARKKAEWIRENLPTCAKVAAEFREAFGDVRLAYAAENGNVIGRKA